MRGDSYGALILVGKAGLGGLGSADQFFGSALRSQVLSSISSFVSVGIGIFWNSYRGSFGP